MSDKISDRRLEHTVECRTYTIFLILQIPFSNEYYFRYLLWVSVFFVVVNIYADSITVSQRMGSDSTTNHKIRMDFADVNLDTILCFSCCTLCLESSK